MLLRLPDLEHSLRELVRPQLSSTQFLSLTTLICHSGGLFLLNTPRELDRSRRARLSLGVTHSKAP